MTGTPNKRRIKFDDELDCPQCNQSETLSNWTYLKAGFNGIKEGDKDDIDKLECIHCGKIIDYPKME